VGVIFMDGRNPRLDDATDALARAFAVAALIGRHAAEFDALLATERQNLLDRELHAWLHPRTEEETR
jgi:hypothetical protein